MAKKKSKQKSIPVPNVKQVLIAAAAVAILVTTVGMIVRLRLSAAFALNSITLPDCQGQQKTVTLGDATSALPACLDATTAPVYQYLPPPDGHSEVSIFTDQGKVVSITIYPWATKNYLPQAFAGITVNPDDVTKRIPGVVPSANLPLYQDMYKGYRGLILDSTLSDSIAFFTYQVCSPTERIGAIHLSLKGPELAYLEANAAGLAPPHEAVMNCVEDYELPRLDASFNSVVFVEAWPPFVNKYGGGAQVVPFKLSFSGDYEMNIPCERIESQNIGGVQTGVKKACSFTTPQDVATKGLPPQGVAWTLTAPTTITDSFGTPYTFIGFTNAGLGLDPITGSDVTAAVIGDRRDTDAYNKCALLQGSAHNICQITLAPGANLALRAEYAAVSTVTVNSDLPGTLAAFEDLNFQDNPELPRSREATRYPGYRCPAASAVRAASGGNYPSEVSGETTLPSVFCIINDETHYYFKADQFPRNAVNKDSDPANDAPAQNNTDDVASGHAPDGNDFVFGGWDPLPLRTELQNLNPALYVGPDTEPGCYDTGASPDPLNLEKSTGEYCKIVAPKGKTKAIKSRYYTTTLRVSGALAGGAGLNLPIKDVKTDNPNGLTKRYSCNTLPCFYSEPTSITATLEAPAPYYNDPVSKQWYQFERWIGPCDNGDAVSTGFNHCRVFVPQSYPGEAKAVTAQYKPLAAAPVQNAAPIIKTAQDSYTVKGAASLDVPFAVLGVNRLSAISVTLQPPAAGSRRQSTPTKLTNCSRSRVNERTAFVLCPVALSQKGTWKLVISATDSARKTSSKTVSITKQ